MENEVKEPAPKYNYISPDEYLEMERASDQKHEYYDGLVVAMSGASMEHNQIAMNLYSKIASFLDDKNCRIYPSDLRVSTPGRDTYIYPDASIVCGKPELEDNRADTLINPAVVFEILSRSTKKNDVGYKLIWYQHIPSLQEYIMIDSTKRFVQTVRKQADGAWRFEDIFNASAEFTIQTINFSIALDDIYRHTEL
jgi:Uma2 family endonuclease